GPAANMPFGIHPHMLRHSCIQLGSSWPIRVWILGRCNTISATRTSSTPSDTASFRRIGFETFGKTERRSAAESHVAQSSLASRVIAARRIFHLEANHGRGIFALLARECL